MSDNKDHTIEVEVIDKSEEKLIDQIPRTYILLRDYWEAIDTNLPKNLNRFIQYVAQYRNKYINLLETPYPIDYPPWKDDNVNKIYALVGIDKDDMTATVEECVRGPDGWVDKYLGDKTTGILLNMIIRWLKMNNKVKELPIFYRYVGYSIYWAVHVRYFKVYKPKASIMKYTIDNMTYKSSLKSIGSVDMWLTLGVEASYKTYEEKLLRGADYDLYYIAEKVKAKFDGYMKNIFRENEKNSKAGNHVFVSSDEVNEVLIENEGNLSEIISASEKYTSRFFASPISEKAIRIAKEAGTITERDLRNTVLYIADNPNNLNDVKKFYQSLIYLFVTDTKYTLKDVGGIAFYGTMIKMYKPGNTTDPNRITIKDMLDKWLDGGSKTYHTSTRQDTLSKFRKSLYAYFLLKLMEDK